jgi:Tfp pilus assembly protein PilX
MPHVINQFTARLCKDQSGFVLPASLTLMTTLVLLGTTAFILTSTDIKTASNFRNSRLVLDVAIAGAERAREALRLENLASSNNQSFSDELNSAARKGANGTLDGYSSTTDDVPLATGTLNNVTYSAYLSNDSVDGATNTTDSNGLVMITSVATGPNNARAQVQIVVSLQSFPISSPATIYAKGDVTGNGSSLTISGNDACGVATALSPIYTEDPATTNFSGNPALSGNPSTPQHGTLNIDLTSYMNALKSGATILTQDQNGATYGSASNYGIVYSWPDDPANFNNQGLKLQNVTGYGILLVNGDLELGGGFQWNGIIIVTGAITLNGGGNDINISGQVYSGTSTLTDITINGGNNIGFDSCKVKNAMAAAPLKLKSWKQNFN